MRIIAGTAKGVQLKTPNFSGTRPMTDKLRGAIFNKLNEEVSEARVLDIYAGTGAVGIEALSRGAQHVDFVDSSFRATQLIKANTQLAKVEKQASVFTQKAEQFIQHVAREISQGQALPYDLVFFTPPYPIFSFVVLDTLALVVHQDSTVVAEMSAREEQQSQLEELIVWDEKKSSDTKVLFLVKKLAEFDK